MPRKIKHTPATFLENLASIRAHALQNDWTRFVTLIMFFSFMLGTALTTLTVTQVSAATATKPSGPTIGSLARDMAALSKRIDEINRTVGNLSDRVKKIESTSPAQIQPIGMMPLVQDGTSSTTEPVRLPPRGPMDLRAVTGTVPNLPVRTPRQNDQPPTGDACKQRCVDSLSSLQLDTTDPTYTARLNRCVASNCP